MANTNFYQHTNPDVFNPIKDDKKQSNCNCSNACDKTNPLPLSESLCEITNIACENGYGTDDIRCFGFCLVPFSFVLDIISCPVRLCINLRSK